MSTIGKSILKGAREALAYSKGEQKHAKVHTIKIPKHVDVKRIRAQLHLSRQEFATRFGFSLRTLEKWEQGMREPEGPTRAYLMVIAYNSKVVEKALFKACA